MSNTYSKSYLQSSPHLRVISDNMVYDRLLPILDKAATSNSPIDIHDVNQALTMDFVSAYLFGLKNASNLLQDESARNSIIHFYQCRKPYEFYNQEIPEFVSWLKSFGIRLIPRWCDDANEVLGSWTLDLCDRADQSQESKDLHVEPLIYKQLKQAMAKELPAKEDDPEKYAKAVKQQRLDIACEIYDQLTAGHETSAVGLTYLFWELSQKPELQKELREELLTLDPPITYPRKSSETELPLPKSIDSLPLLEGIVTETLRLHAPIPGIQPRVTPYPSCTLAGYSDIPPNTRVNAQAYSLHRNPDVYPEPETWQPKRWLKEYNSTADLEMRRRWYWAFGSGGRMCVGSNLALQGMYARIPRRDMLTRSEMKLAVATLYSNYTTTIVNDDDIEATDEYTVKPKGGKLILKLTPA